MKLIETLGATSRIWQIFVADSSSTTGAGLTGLTQASAGLTAYYHRDTDTTATAITLVTMTVGTFTSSGFKEIDATNMPGWYQFCPPNACLASGAKSCGFLLKGATNLAPLPIEVELTAVDLQDATAAGISRIDAAISSRMATYTQPTGFLAATFPSGTVANTTNITAGTITTVTTVTNQLTAAQIATGVWQDTTAGDFTVALSVGKSLMNGVALGTGLTVNDLTTKTGFALTSAYDPAKTASQAGDVMKVSSGTGANQINLSSGNLAGSVASVVGAVGSVTGNVSGSVGSISGITFPTNFSATLISVGGAVTVGTLNAGVIDAASLATAAKTAISDNLLDRDMSTGTDTGTNLVRTVRQALRVLRNKVDTVGGNVYKEDDATSSWTFTVTTAAGNPIVLVDPT